VVLEVGVLVVMMMVLVMDGLPETAVAVADGDDAWVADDVHTVHSILPVVDNHHEPLGVVVVVVLEGTAHAPHHTRLSAEDGKEDNKDRDLQKVLFPLNFS
jgi:hypothetical protein